MEPTRERLRGELQTLRAEVRFRFEPGGSRIAVILDPALELRRGEPTRSCALPDAGLLHVTWAAGPEVDRLVLVGERRGERVRLVVPFPAGGE